MAEVSYLQLHEHDDDLDAFSPTNDSILFDRVNFVIDMFHQTVEQSQSHGTVDDCWDDFFVSRTTPPQSIPNPNNDHQQIDDTDLLDYNYEILFGQFLDTGRPPASPAVVDNLLSLLINNENNVVCAVCKDDILVGLTAKKLPCHHVYHADCILPWLGIRNTCPVCRYELLTDDLEYERRKAGRGATDHD